MTTAYSYTKSPVAIDRLTQEVNLSAITIALDHMDLLGNALTIYFKTDLPDADKAILDTLVANHTGVPLPSPAQQVALTDGNGNVVNQLDVDNAMIVRVKAAKKGWTYAAVGFQFQLSTPAGVTAMNFDGTSKTWITGKYYDVNGTLVTDVSFSSTVVKTVIDFEPPYDYECIGGELRQTSNLIQDVYLSIIAVPDVPAAYGGSKVMAEGLNLKYLAPGNVFQVDGRVSKLLSYNATNHTNKLRFVLLHPAGLSEELMITIELYRQ